MGCSAQAESSTSAQAQCHTVVTHTMYSIKTHYLVPLETSEYPRGQYLIIVFDWSCRDLKILSDIILTLRIMSPVQR